ncbi:GerAB/ArcD/ProY family transporter [Bacillus alkalicellulosilyticus]|uniref:GerAB/ArcD/ProY family transporter n=1 Tax=Alkalihalobacterium alkalicellulosilyticum TaxID=1912214 RepID=UPI0014833A07|nr:GerAB/ArcD/ProY family transporter [Bacillus alkalicellulosilyticus]
MKTVQKTLKSFDLFAFTVSSTISVGIAFLPYVAGEEIRSAWLKVMIGSLPFFGFLFLLHLFNKRYSTGDFFLELKKRIWKPVYWLIIGYLFISIIYAGGIVLTGMGAVVNTYLLPNTSQWVYILFFLVVVAVGVYYGLAAIIRFVVLTIVIEFSILLVIIAIGFTEPFRWIYIPPVMDIDISLLLKSTISDFARYSGLVTLLGLVVYSKPNQSIIKPTSFGLLFVLIVYTALSIVVLGTFGFEESLQLISPFIALVQTYSTAGGVIERLDLIFLAFWLVLFFKIIIIHIWFLVLMLKKNFPNVNGKWFILLICGMLFVLNLFLPPIISDYWRVHNFNTAMYALVLPSVLLIYLLLRKKGGRQA